MIKFVIEDEWHAEVDDEFPDLDQALRESERRAKIPWDQSPNKAPCVGWKGCGRSYYVLEVDATRLPWKELRRVPVLEISAAGVTWARGDGRITSKGSRRHS